jgi:hypothetical protein
VKSRHPRPERNFEIVAGKVLDSKGNATRFAFARNGGADGANMARLALRRSGANENTSIAFLTDGDGGLRAIHQQVAPRGRAHSGLVSHRDAIYESSTDCKRCFQPHRGWSPYACARRAGPRQMAFLAWLQEEGLDRSGAPSAVGSGPVLRAYPALKKLAHALSETIRYLELNADSMPNYGKRYRGGLRISTGFVESSVNEIIARRMAKRQQMRWSKHTVQSFLDVRIHVLNGTLEDAFRHWHRGFRPATAPAAAA